MRRIVLLFIIFSAVSLCPGAVITVDDDGPANFNNIQVAIDFASYGDTIQVAEGTYIENITLKNGFALIGQDPNSTIIDGNDNGTVVYSEQCDSNTVLEGFTITGGNANGTSWPDNSGGGMFNIDSNSIVANCIFSNNVATYGGGMEIFASNSTVTGCIFIGNTAFCGGGICNDHYSEPVIIGCTFSGNSSYTAGGGLIYGPYSNQTLKNCIFWRNKETFYDHQISYYNMPGITSESVISYCNIEGCGGSGAGWDTTIGIDGGGNIDADPCFAEPGYWDPNGTPSDTNDDFWVDGDYHLQSQGGRWVANSQSWVMDANTSPCIDAGDWMSPVGFEPFPNGGRVNMGAYGGTIEASKSYFGTEPCETIIAGDINGDCKVDFIDFAIMSLHWLEDARP